MNSANNTMDKKNNAKAYPCYIDNAPCEEDLFEGKSHTNIAGSIYSLIKSNNNCNIIGLDGGWGSGKSNLVSLIEKQFEKAGEKYHFFIYDAWGHQDDIQRRSILEELTIDLTAPLRKDSESILDNKKWGEKLKLLLSKSREIKTKSIPRFSCGLILSFLAVVATPITTVISDKFIPCNFWKIVIVCIPLIAIFIYWCYICERNCKKYHKKKKIDWILKLTTAEAFNVYSDKKREDQTNETIAEDIPSSRKFKDWMKDIDNDLNDYKVIFVFDNMDRLPKQKVQELWAAIQSFFSDIKYNNIRVIVPFDREHIISAFSDEDQGHQDDSDEEQTLKNGKRCYGNDFINKTFNVVYWVSPPTMSDWKKYFFERWQDAFGKELDIKDSVTQIYDLLTEIKTPRKIIAFINEFVTLKRLFKENIPNKYIALFILGRDFISRNPDKEILSPTYLRGIDFLFKNDNDLPKYLSALYYQLPAKKALDLVYTEKIRNDLDKNNVAELNSISGLSIFYELLESAITNISNIPNAVMALSECFENKTDSKIQSMWDCIYHQVNDMEDHIQEYQLVLLNKITNKLEYAKRVVAGLYVLLDFNPISFYEDMNKLSTIKEINVFNIVKEKEVKAEAFIPFVELAGDTYQKYKIKCGETELNEYLSSKSVEDLGNLKALPYLENDYNLDTYKKRLYTMIDENVSNRNNISILYERLKEIEKPVGKELDSNRIYQFFNGLPESDNFYYDLVCMRMKKLNNFSPSPSYLQAAFNDVLSRSEDDFVEKIANRIEYYMDFGDLLCNVDRMDSSMLYKSVCKYLIKNDSILPHRASISSLLQKYNVIKSELEIEDAGELMDCLNGWSFYAKDEITKDNVKDIPIEFFEDSVKIDCELTEHCKEMAQEYLQSISLDDWKKSISGDSYETKLLLTLKPNQKIQYCFDAFKELLKECAKGNTKLDKGTCSGLIELALSNKRELLIAFNDVRDLFCSGQVTMAPDLFDFFGEWLLIYSKLEDKPEALRTIFIPSIMDNPINVKLMIHYSDTIEKIFKNAGEENKDFREKIESLLEKEYREDESFISFAKLFGVEKIETNDAEIDKS